MHTTNFNTAMKHNTPSENRPSVRVGNGQVPPQPSSPKIGTRGALFAGLPHVLGVFLILVTSALPNGQNTCDNWPISRDPDWIALKAHLDWCHNALVERYSVAGLNTANVHVPTYIYPFYDYREFLKNVEDVAPYFVDHTKVGTDGTFNKWFTTLVGPVQWHESPYPEWDPSVWLPTYSWWYYECDNPRQSFQYPYTGYGGSGSLCPLDFPKWTYTNLLQQNELGALFRSTTELPGTTLTVPGWTVDQWFVHDYTLNIPNQTIFTDNDISFLDELPLRIWIDAALASDIAGKVATAIMALKWTATTGTFKNTTVSTAPRVRYYDTNVYPPQGRDLPELTPDWENATTTTSDFNFLEMTGLPTWHQVWTIFHGSMPTANRDDYWSILEMTKTTDYTVECAIPASIPGTAESYIDWHIDTLHFGLWGLDDVLGPGTYNIWPWLAYCPYYWIGDEVIPEYVTYDSYYIKTTFERHAIPRNTALDHLPERFRGAYNVFLNGYDLIPGWPKWGGLPYSLVGSGYVADKTSSQIAYPTTQVQCNQAACPTLATSRDILYCDERATFIVDSAPGFHIQANYLPLVLLKWDFPSGEPPSLQPPTSAPTVPDTDRDDLVDTGVETCSLGQDSGLMTYLPQQPDPYLVIPQVQPPAWYAGLDVKAYFTSQNHMLPYWHNVKTLSTWRNPNAASRRATDNDGYDNAYSLNTRILDAGATINAGIKKAVLIRPRGQVVNFKFEEVDSVNHVFSSFGYPEAPYDGQSYVLVDLTPNNHYDVAFELRFSSGIVHVFSADGLLTQIKDHRGYCVDMNKNVYGEVAVFGSASWFNSDPMSEANVGPVGATDKRYSIVNTWLAGRLKEVTYQVGSQTITVTLGYDSDGMIQSVTKSQLTESDATRAGNVITYGTGAKLTRSGTGPVTITRTVPSEAPLSVAYTLDSGNRVTREVVSANGGTATTTYKRDTGVSRYPKTGALGAAKIVKITYPDNAEVGYTYDPDTGWLSTETRPIGNSSSRIWEYAYSPLPISAPGDNPYGGTRTNMLERARVVNARFNSTIVGRTLYAFTGPSVQTRRCRSASANWNDSLNLQYSTTVIGTGLTAGRPSAETRPASQNSSWTYVITGGNLTIDTSRSDDASATKDTVNAFGNNTLNKITTLDTLVHHVTATPDDFGRITQEDDVLSGDSRQFQSYCLHGPQTVIEIDNTTSTYQYTPLGYVKKLSKPAFGRTTTWKYDALGNAISKVLVAQDKTWTETAAFDAQNRLTHHSTPQTYWHYEYSSTTEGTKIITTRPKLGSIDEYYYFDGSLKKRCGGGATVRTQYGYAIEDAQYRVERIALDNFDVETSERTKTFYNLLGAVAEVRDGNNKIYTPHYDSYGRQDGAQDPNAYQYPVQYHPTRNETEKTGVGDVSESGNNPVRKHERNANTTVGQEWKTLGYPDKGSGASVVLGATTLSRDRKTSTSTSMGLTDSSTRNSPYTSPGHYTTLTTLHNNRQTEATHDKWRIQEEKRRDSSGFVEETVTYTHNELGALRFRTSTRNGTFTYNYDGVHRLYSIVPPDGRTGLTTINYFANTTLHSTIMKNDGTTYGCDYTPAGLLREEYLISGTGSGAGTGGNTHYFYEYDAQGRLMFLRYFSGGSFRTTEWNYEPTTGRLMKKIFPDSSFEEYEYYANGQIWKIKPPSRSSPMTQEYFYDPQNALLTRMTVAGGGVDINSEFDRFGRPWKASVVGGVAQTLARESDGQPGLETVTGNSVINNGTVNRTYFAKHRGVNAVTHTIASGDSGTTTYTYNDGPRVETVTRGNIEVTYDYNPYALALDFVEWKKNSTPVLSCLVDWDIPNTRIAKLTYSAGGTTLAIYDYTYIPNGHRIQTITLKDGSYWKYQYDGRGYLLFANQYDSTGTPILGRQFSFPCDTMGNIVQGGPSDPSGVPMYSFTANSLNLHISRIWGSQVEVAGTADPTAAVTVNGVTASRQGSLFRAIIPVANSSAAVDLPVNVYATMASGGNQLLAQASGRVYVPKASETMPAGDIAYTDNGEHTKCSKYTKQYNGLGWLTEVTSVIAIPQFQLKFDYYPDGRRARKRYYEETSPGTWALKREHHFYYDNRLLVAEKVVDNGTTYWNRYTWGLDIAGRLSGRMGQDAGGIGGLLAIQRVEGSTTTTYLPICDHNGNILAVVDADTSTVVAEYAYSPYGTLIASSGPAKDKFPLRFQSKYYDHETGFLYYGYRYYDPQTCKWLSRDPLGESGGVNLTAAFAGDPINFYDKDGLTPENNTTVNETPIVSCNVPTPSVTPPPPVIRASRPNPKLRPVKTISVSGKNVLRSDTTGKSYDTLEDARRDGCTDAIEGPPSDRSLTALADWYRRTGQPDKAIELERDQGGILLLTTAIQLIPVGRTVAKPIEEVAVAAVERQIAKNAVVSTVAKSEVQTVTVAAETTPSLVHLTDQTGLAGINQSSSIVGRHGIFAVPEYVTSESTAMKVARTGLSPAKTAAFVPIPSGAQGFFQQPVPIGPYSAWKYFGGVHYAPPGAIDIVSGAFTSASSLIGPRTLIYGPDVLFYGGTIATGGLYLYGGGGE